MKIIARILLLTILLNTVFATANAMPKQSDLQEIFGDEIYICSAENSFDLAITDYEKLLHYAYQDNQHEKSQQQDIQIGSNNIYEINYLKSNSIVNLGLEKTDFFSNIFSGSINPRAPPFVFV